MTKYEHGQFSWIDLMSPDARAASAYYQQLFDWSAVDQDNGQHGVYTQFFCGDNVVAGLGEMNEPMKQSGMPAMWNTSAPHRSTHPCVPVTVETREGASIESFTYHAERGAEGRKPSRRYLRLLLTGARHHALPQQ
jgi:hypothetical protein